MKQFQVDASSSPEVVLEAGPQIQLDPRSALTVRRANQLRAERLGEVADQGMDHDGKSPMVGLPKQGVFATLPAAPPVGPITTMPPPGCVSENLNGDGCERCSTT